MTGFAWLLVCPLAYLLAGSLKFAINSLKARRLAFHQVGLGRFPSTHTAIASAPAWLIALTQGIDMPVFAVAIALTMIVVIDAMDLRRRLEQVHGVLKKQFPHSPDAQRLRDRVGHSAFEVAGGLAMGGVAALIFKTLV